MPSTLKSQFPPSRLLATGDFERLAKTGFNFIFRLRFSLSALFAQQFSSHAVELGVESSVTILFGNSQPICYSREPVRPSVELPIPVAERSSHAEPVGLSCISYAERERLS